MTLKKLLGFVALAVAFAPAAHAGLTLTAGGVTAGFTLTTFVSGYNFGNYGPLSQAVLPNGNIVTGSVGSGQLYVFKDVDNQTLGDALIANPYAFETGNPHFAMATVAGQAYGGQLFGGRFYHFANDGSYVPIGGATGTDLVDYLGIWGSVSGKMIASTNRGLVEIDPVSGAYRIINPGLFPDGVSVSPDGTIAYIENGGIIQSYDIATGALIRSYFSTGGHGADGTGVIIGGLYDGDVIVNNNDGTLGLLDVDNDTMLIIAMGGSRGDFTSADTSNGTLFISQIEQVLRLSCGAGCTIGGPGGNTVPEPNVLVLMVLALAAAAWSRRRKQ
ncbi:PEP-CTERM sorting domain-containing protein [Roseateles sp. P5_E11]